MEIDVLNGILVGQVLLIFIAIHFALRCSSPHH